MMVMEGAAELRKTLALRSDQTSQEMSIMREASALGEPRRIFRLAFHHSLTKALVTQVDVVM